MSAFQRASQTNARGVRTLTTPAPKKLTLEPQHFCSTWQLKPAQATVIGLRVPPERDFEGAAIEARRSVADKVLGDGGEEDAFERAYARILVARAICDPENVNAAHQTVPLPDDQIARAFPPATIHWLFDEIDKLHVEQSPGYAEATDEEVRRLSDILNVDSPLSDLGRYEEARVRRYVNFILSELES
jgi:hypothetical protein